MAFSSQLPSGMGFILGTPCAERDKGLLSHSQDYSIIATTLAGAAEAPTIFKGKTASLNPW